jgi:hypothetical protein
MRLALVLVATVLAPIFTPGLAQAACITDSGQVNVAGYSRDAGLLARGTKASLLSPNADADCGIVRSIYVQPSGAGGDFAEVGLFEYWTANLPHPFVAWDGDAGYHDWDASYTVSEQVLYGFRIQDGNGNYNWTGYFTGSILHTTGPLPFNKGRAATNSESDTPSDPGYGNFDTLGWCYAIGCSSWTAFDVACYVDDDPTAHFDRVGTNHHYVQNGQSQGGCAGAT